MCFHNSGQILLRICGNKLLCQFQCRKVTKREKGLKRQKLYRRQRDNFKALEKSGAFYLFNKKFMSILEIAKVLKDAGKIEEYKQILELSEKSLEMQHKIVSLESENRKLKEALEMSKKLKFKNNAYWDGEEGPFCPGCFDKEKSCIRMTTDPGSSIASCPICKTRINYTGEKQVSHPIRRPKVPNFYNNPY